MSERPNVILILSDDQGSRDLGCYGARDLVTPNLDRLAASGVRFTDFYANATVCMPSRTSLLTGRYFPRAILPGQGMKPREITAAQLFLNAGYRTAAFGKWHLGETTAMQPRAKGFERFIGHLSGTVDAYSHFFYAEGVNRHDLYRDGEPYRTPGTYLPDLMVSEAQTFIRDAGQQPFFLYLPFTIPHYPVQPRPEHRELYESMELDDDRRVLYGAYLTTMDDCIGQVLATVEAQGLTQRTIVIFLSDNGHSTETRALGGGGSAGPFRGGKHNLWEGGIRVPCLASWPGTIPAGAVREQPAMGIDWLPTLAEYCRVPLPEDRAIDGRSLSAILASAGAPPVHERLHWVHYDGSFAVREGDWKLHSRRGQDMWLADVRADPGERVNRAEEERERVRELSRRHNQWLLSVAADSPELTENRRAFGQ